MNASASENNDENANNLDVIPEVSELGDSLNGVSTSQSSVQQGNEDVDLISAVSNSEDISTPEKAISSEEHTVEPSENELDLPDADTVEAHSILRTTLESMGNKKTPSPVKDIQSKETSDEVCVLEVENEESAADSGVVEALDSVGADGNGLIHESKDVDTREDDSSVNIEETEGSGDIEVIELDQDSGVAESDKIKSTKTNEDSTESASKSVSENEVDVLIEESKNDSSIEINEKIEDVDMLDVDPISVEPKPRRRGRRRKEEIQTEQIATENGVVEVEEEEAEDSVTGRPRRKAAKKAGDVIRQMVEEDPPEFVYGQGEDAEEWSSSENTCPPRKICYQCCRLRPCQYHLLVNGVSRYMCTTPCFQAFRKNHPPKPGTPKKVNEVNPNNKDPVHPSGNTEIIQDEAAATVIDGKGAGDTKERVMVLECAYCHNTVSPPTLSDKSLSWETMEFCDEECLGKYQDQLGSNCSQCKVPVQRISMGKYCVRFGYNIKQFCCSTCLEEFKKGLKACTYCQKDISACAEGFLAPVGDKGQFKDFCSSVCMEKYDNISTGARPSAKEAPCAVCDKVGPVAVEVVTGWLSNFSATNDSGTTVYSLCSEPCFAAFKFVNKVKAEQCDSCHIYFDTSRPEIKPAKFFHDGGYHCCCRTCLHIFILTRRSIVQCNWCRVKKYDFDMIKRISSSGQVLMMCSLNCLSLYHVSISAVSSRRVKCDFCSKLSQAQYHLTMSDATVRNFCSYDCVMTFQSQYSKTPLTLPEEDRIHSPHNSATGPIPAKETEKNASPIPVISSVTSLASVDGNNSQDPVCTPVSLSSAASVINHISQTNSKITAQSNVLANRQIIVKPPGVKPICNKGTTCRPKVESKSVGCHVSMVDGSCQTDPVKPHVPAFLPIPFPIAIPLPFPLLQKLCPVPLAIPIPLPIPIFIPCKLSAAEIIQKKKTLSSVSPEEAQMLMMAELAANEEEDDVQKLESLATDEDSTPATLASGEEDNESVVQPDPDVDIEECISLSTVYGPAYIEAEDSGTDDPDMEKTEGNKRKAGETGYTQKAKRRRISITSANEEEEKHNELNASLGVSAWQVWVQQKNSELSKVTSNSRRLKLFKTELLQMTLEELNYALCLFVKEIRKPGGEMYAPDTILYFCLGIQYYLMENGRTDNIFTDLYFEKFTECLDQVARTYPALTLETRLITTRVNEEHLWESRQLGAHSPYVLLATLVFFNTKYFSLWTVEDHAKLNFTNVIKCWRKSRPKEADSTLPGTSSSRPANFSLLRYVHKDKSIDDENLEQKMYEMHENVETPLRCPVKLYEFYLSKCPDPIKRIGDVFYLLPERACVPDSPVWYSSVALGPDALGKMLHRIHMVKEINEAYTSELAKKARIVVEK